MSAAAGGVNCRVYRARRQPELYVYLREGFEPEDLPEPLSARTGPLTEVMTLRLDAARKLARVDVRAVIAALTTTGWFVQMPPGGLVNAQLYSGD